MTGEDLARLGYTGTRLRQTGTPRPCRAPGSSRSTDHAWEVFARMRDWGVCLFWSMHDCIPFASRVIRLRWVIAGKIELESGERGDIAREH